jgi:hypothetical protein
MATAAAATLASFAQRGRREHRISGRRIVVGRFAPRDRGVMRAFDLRVDTVGSVHRVSLNRIMDSVADPIWHHEDR